MDNLKKIPPTLELHGELQTAYDFFNDKLFNNSLPECLLTAQREKRDTIQGHHWHNKYISKDGVICSEISLNPIWFSVKPIIDTLATLVHEMAHLWQWEHGNPTRSGYHNKEWGYKMEEVGLIPSNTGEPNGRKTGQQMTHYIDADGSFFEHVQTLLDTGFSISWFDRNPPIMAEAVPSIETEPHKMGIPQGLKEPLGKEILGDVVVLEKKKKAATSGNRFKYVCDTCKTQFYGKSDMNVICGDCQTVFSIE